MCKNRSVCEPHYGRTLGTAATVLSPKQSHMKSHYHSSHITNPSAYVVNSHPVTDSKTQLSHFGHHHHHYAGVTSVAASQCCLSLPLLSWTIGLERRGNWNHTGAPPLWLDTKHGGRKEGVGAGGFICLRCPLEEHWSWWSWAAVLTLAGHLNGHFPKHCTIHCGEKWLCDDHHSVFIKYWISGLWECHRFVSWGINKPAAYKR